MSSTPFFGITAPDANEVGYIADLSSFFTGVETTIGQNCHLILTGDTGSGGSDVADLGFISSGTVVKKAGAGSSRWGRVSLQATLPNGTEVLTRLAGITALTGAGGSFGDPVYHSATLDEVVTAPASAVVDGTNRIVFLSMGMCLGSGTALFTGLLPIEVCPIVMAGQIFEHKDGTNNPTAGLQQVYASGVIYWQAPFDGATQDIDAVFPIQVPADFGSFPNKSGAAFWGLRTRFKRENISASGYAGGQIVAFVDTAGTEFTSLGTALEQADVWTDQVVSWATLNGLGAVMTPGRTCFVRVKLRGNNADFMDFETPVMQYFPAKLWN